MRLFCILALVTAGRKTAILELTWDRVDFRRGLIHLERPGNFPAKGRAIVPMTDRARETLAEAYKGRLTDHVIETNGAPLKDMKKGFTASAMRASLDDVTPHDLRHTAAVWMAESGMSMPEIAQYLGHTDPSIHLPGVCAVFAGLSQEGCRGAELLKAGMEHCPPARESWDSGRDLFN